ncbi:MAG: hypothetical protein ACRC5H_02700 [Treponemataceae bacterium]
MKYEPIGIVKCQEMEPKSKIYEVIEKEGYEILSFAGFQQCIIFSEPKIRCLNIFDYLIVSSNLQLGVRSGRMKDLYYGNLGIDKTVLVQVTKAKKGKNYNEISLYIYDVPVKDSPKLYSCYAAGDLSLVMSEKKKYIKKGCISTPIDNNLYSHSNDTAA